MFDLPGMTYWGWFAVGLVLLAFELIAPLTFFLWLGISALVTGLAALVLPGMPWEMQFLVFSILSVISIVISRRYLVGRQIKSDLPNLNRRAQQYVGRVFTLSEDIQQGVGKIKVRAARLCGSCCGPRSKPIPECVRRLPNCAKL